MDWELLISEDQLDQIKQRSEQTPQLIFKHSTRCFVSSMARRRLERTSAPGQVDFHFLDLIKYRNISNKVERDFMVDHESPQILLIKNGQCIYTESHSGISMNEIEKQVNNIML